MSYPVSAGAYADCYDMMDKALDDEVGIRLAVESVSAGEQLRARCYKARAINRVHNAKIYPDPDHPLNDASVYDSLVCRVRIVDDEDVYLYIEKVPDNVNVEKLSEIRDKSTAPPKIPVESLTNLLPPDSPFFRRRV
jgi:hypothetical protein